MSHVITPSAAKIIGIAKSQVGVHEGHNSHGWNNIQKYSPAVPGLEWSQGQPWCAVFVSWCAMEADFSDLYPRTASTDAGAAWWKAQGRWHDYPAIGAQGYLAHSGDEYHTFLVVEFDDEFIYTVEGNTNNNGSAQGDGVYALRRRRRDTVVEGYGYPDFPEGILSADPNYPKPIPPKGKRVVNLKKIDAPWKQRLLAQFAKNRGLKPEEHSRIIHQLNTLREQKKLGLTGRALFYAAMGWDKKAKEAIRERDKQK